MPNFNIVPIKSGLPVGHRSTVAFGGRTNFFQRDRTPSTSGSNTNWLDTRFNDYAYGVELGYPRLFNQFIPNNAQVLSTGLALAMAKYDLAIMDGGLASFRPNFLGFGGLIKQANPKIKLLAYFSCADIYPTGEIGPFPNNTIKLNFTQGIPSGWYVKDLAGNPVNVFNIRSGVYSSMYNHTIPAARTYMASGFHAQMEGVKLFDGMFFDWLEHDWNFLYTQSPAAMRPSGGVDLNNDGVAESGQVLIDAWMSGFIPFLAECKSTFYNDSLLVGNYGYSGRQNDLDVTNVFNEYVNGGMVEQFLQGSGSVANGWSAIMRTVKNSNTFSKKPKIDLIMSNRADEADYTFMRFSLATTLLTDAYFTFTTPNTYSGIRWYDEYSVNLITGEAIDDVKYKHWMGRPVTPAFSPISGILLDTALSSSILGFAETLPYMKKYKEAIVLCNPTPNPYTFDLGGTYKKIRGWKDTTFNDGASLTGITLQQNQGAILLNVVR